MRAQAASHLDENRSITAACRRDILTMNHSLPVAGLFRILAILSAMQITSVSINAEKPFARSSSSPRTAGDNPLLAESALPYHAPPFDKIKDEHFAPAFEKGMADELKEADTIANNSEKPT